MISKTETTNRLLLSTTRALLGEITPNIREITCALDDCTIIIRCYFEGQITEENEESMDSVEAEVIADFTGYAIDLKCVTINMPESLKQHRLSAWVYMRKE